MPSGSLPTGIVAVTLLVFRSMTETVLSWLFPITARLSPLSIATPLGAFPTGIVERTVWVLISTIET